MEIVTIIIIPNIPLYPIWHNDEKYLLESMMKICMSASNKILLKKTMYVV